MKTINMFGVKGGVGTTTTSVALAVKLSESLEEDKIVGITTSQKDDLSTSDMYGVAGYRSDDHFINHNLVLYPTDVQVDYLIVDNGFATKDTDYSGDETIFVVNNSYLALKRAVMLDLNLDSKSHAKWISIIYNDGALIARDIDDVLSIRNNIRCDIPFDQSIGRSVDAGVIARRIPSVMNNLDIIINSIK